MVYLPVRWVWKCIIRIYQIRSIGWVKNHWQIQLIAIDQIWLFIWYFTTSPCMQKLVQEWKSIRMSSGMLQSNCLQLQLVLQSWNGNSRTLATILQRLGDGCDVSFCLVVRSLFQDLFFKNRACSVHPVSYIPCFDFGFLTSLVLILAWWAVAQVAQLQLELEENRVAQDIFVVNLLWWSSGLFPLICWLCAVVSGATPEIISWCKDAWHNSCPFRGIMKSFFQKCDPYTADKEGTAVQRIWQSTIGDAARGWSQNSTNSRIINLIKLYKLGAPEDIQRISCILKHTELIDEDLRINNQTSMFVNGAWKKREISKRPWSEHL